MEAAAEREDAVDGAVGALFNLYDFLINWWHLLGEQRVPNLELRFELARLSQLTIIRSLLNLRQFVLLLGSASSKILRVDVGVMPMQPRQLHTQLLIRRVSIVTLNVCDVG